MLQNFLKLYYETTFNNKNSNHYINTTLLYVILILLFPVSLHYDFNILYTISIPTLYVCYFIIILLTLDNIFLQDKNDGHILEYHFISKKEIYNLVVVKLFIKWVYISITLSVGVFVGFILFNIELVYYLYTVSTLIFITPVLLSIGTINTALLIGLKEKGILISLLTLPIYVPVLISSITILQSRLQGEFSIFQYPVFIIFFSITCTVSPMIITYILKIWSS